MNRDYYLFISNKQTVGRSWWKRFRLTAIFNFVGTVSITVAYCVFEPIRFLWQTSIIYPTVHTILICYHFIIGVPFAWKLVQKCRQVFIPRYFYGSRRIMEKHDLSLHDVLWKNYEEITNQNDVLVEVDENARRNLTFLENNFQNLLKSSSLEFILAGSTAERFNIPLSSNWLPSEIGIGDFSHAMISDFDFMVSPVEHTAGFECGSSKYLVITEGINLHHGFVYIVDNDTKSNLKSHEVKEKLLATTQGMQLQNLNGYRPFEKVWPWIGLAKETADGKNFAEVKVKGPAVEIRFGESVNVINRFYSDVTFALKCPKWPDQLTNWALRTDRKWPPVKDVNRIAKQGCHFVPKSQLGDYQGLTWRVSFSMAEVELSKLIPPVARACFIGLKVIAKDYLSVACERISSYHLKCVFYYTLEQTGTDVWKKEHTVQCFHHLLQNLIQCVTEKKCPHFWIPNYNLFGDFSNSDVKRLLKVLYTIQKAPQQFIERFLTP